MNKVTLTGAAAEVRWSYHQAAALGAWRIDGDSVSASVVSHDAFRLSQQPLTFVVRRRSGQSWTWPITSVMVQDGLITARLCPQEA